MGLVVAVCILAGGRIVGEILAVVLFRLTNDDELVVNADGDNRVGVVGNCASAASKKSLKLSFF